MPQIFTGTEVARPAYYDRQAITAMIDASTHLLPSGQTVRATYAPAFPYAAFVESIYVSIQRATAAAPVNASAIMVRYYPFFGGVITVMALTCTSNVVGFVESDHQPDFGYMAYGDAIKLETFDIDTGGALDTYASMKATEFRY